MEIFNRFEIDFKDDIYGTISFDKYYFSLSEIEKVKKYTIEHSKEKIKNKIESNIITKQSESKDKNYTYEYDYNGSKISGNYSARIKDDYQKNSLDASEVIRLIKSYSIDRNTLMWRPGLEKWMPASEIPEVAEMFKNLNNQDR